MPGPTLTVSSKTVLTGWSKDSGYDRDGDGLYEFLQVDVELSVAQAGNYGFTTALIGPQEQFVAVGALTPDIQRTAPVTGVALTVGRQVVPIYFDGRAIRSSRTDGPYIVRVGLSDAADMVGVADFTTQPYKHLDFQGSLFEMQSIGDSGVDSDALPGYNLLRIAVKGNMLAVGEVHAQGQLFAGGTFLADAAVTVSLGPGSQILHLDFPGDAIAASGLDGPYTVYLSFWDGSNSTNQIYTTGVYKHTDFQLPVASFTGSIMDTGIDSDGDGLYEQLEVKVEVVAIVPGTYSIGAILEDGSGNRIDTAETKVKLSRMPSEIALRFSGTAISRHGADGPYQVVLGLKDATDNEVMGQRYATSAYSGKSFQGQRK